MPIEKKLARADLEIKSFDEGSHVIRGMATTPGPDRVGDVVEPMGAKFAAEIPLFLYHDSRMQVGTVKLGPARKSGVPFEATLPDVAEAGTLKTRVEEAWHMLKYGLLKTVSIGFVPLGDTIEQLKNGGLRFLETEILELSLISIPMNPEAQISYIKSLDQAQQRSASGAAQVVRRDANPPGASGNRSKSEPPKGKTMRTIKEQISGAENKRAADVARMGEIMKMADEDGARSLDESESQEYDDLAAGIEQVDKQLVRLRGLEKMQVLAPVAESGSTADVSGTKAAAGAAGNSRTGVFQMQKHNLPKGTGFTRMAIALAFAKGNVEQAANIASRWKDTTPEVAQVLRFGAQAGGTDFAAQIMQAGGMDVLQKTAIAAGTTTDATWASPLVQYNNMASEFVALLYPETILGRLQGVRRVPFNIRFPSQTAGASVGWVGQGAAKPVSKLAFATNTLGFAKAAGIVVITQELARFSSPSAEELVRNDLVNTMAQFLDQQFIGPGVAAVANVSPAGITNGITPTQSGGATRALIDADVATMTAGLLTANIPLSSLTWVMTPYSALKLSMLRETNGEFSYPGITLNGGTWQGIPVVTSNNVPNSVSAGSIIVLMATSEIFLADDGGVQIDASQEASVQMDSAPTNSGATPTPTTLVSLWQDNLVGIRAERVINWQRRRDTAVTYLDNVHL